MLTLRTEPMGTAARWTRRAALCALASSASMLPAAAQGHGEHAEGEDPNRLPDAYLAPQVKTLPSRPSPLLELGDGYLEPGPLREPIRLPTGAIWSPRLTVWGTYRSGLAGGSSGNGDVGEWANRLDLFAEARFSPTERLVLGMRPLDKDGEFSGYDLDNSDWNDGLNTDVSTLFFEGEFGEIFPGLDLEDKKAIDYGFGIGRQRVNFQDGVLINDVMDSITITRNSKRWNGVSNFRTTALVAWNDIERLPTTEDDDAIMLGILTAMDLVDNYVEMDFLATFSNDETAGDGFYIGLGSTQRIGGMNSSFRANASISLDDNATAVDSGLLLTSVLSWVPHHTHDNFYFGSFLGVDDFTSAARAPDAGGPLGNIGMLFAATGLGSLGAPLNAQGASVVGAAVGYQQLFGLGRTQMIYEIGTRIATRSQYEDSDSIAAGARYRRAIGQRAFATLDAFVGHERDRDGFIGGRAEIAWRF